MERWQSLQGEKTSKKEPFALQSVHPPLDLMFPVTRTNDPFPWPFAVRLVGPRRHPREPAERFHALHRPGFPAEKVGADDGPTGQVGKDITGLKGIRVP